MPEEKTASQKVIWWLRQQKLNLAPLTGTDVKALRAGVQILELWNYCDKPEVLAAFGGVIQQMQPSTRGIAWHAIAMVTDWHLRDQVWIAANLPDCWETHRTVCAYEPEGIRLGLHEPKRKKVA